MTRARATSRTGAVRARGSRSISRASSSDKTTQSQQPGTGYLCHPVSYPYLPDGPFRKFGKFGTNEHRLIADSR